MQNFMENFIFAEHTAIGIASVIALNIIVQICKKWVKPKWGETGIHVFTFGLALIAVIGMQVLNSHPELMQAVSYAGQLLVASVALYEVILKKIIKAVTGDY